MAEDLATTFSSVPMVSSPPSPPRRRVHAGTTPHKKKASGGGSSASGGRGRSSLGGGANTTIESTSGGRAVVDKENQRLGGGGGGNNSSSMAQNCSTNCDNIEGLPGKSPGMGAIAGADADADQDDNDRSLSMVLSPDGSQPPQPCAAASGAAEYSDGVAAGNRHDANHRRINTDDATPGSGWAARDDSPALVGADGGRLVLDALDLDLDLSGVSSITGGSEVASLSSTGGGYGHRTPGRTAEYSNRIGGIGGRSSLGSLASASASASMGGGLRTASGKKDNKNKNKNKNNKSRLSMSSAKSSGTSGTSSLLMGMNFLSPSTATTPGGLVRRGARTSSGGGGGGDNCTSTSRPSLGGRPSLGSLSASTSTNASPSAGAITPKPSVGSTRISASASASASATNQIAGKSAGPNKSSSNRRKSTATSTSTSQSRSSSLPSTPGFVSPPRMSRPNFLMSPPATGGAKTPQMATSSGAGGGAGGTNGNSMVLGTSSRADSVLRTLHQKSRADADGGSDIVGNGDADEIGREAADGMGLEDNGESATATQEEDVCMEKEQKEESCDESDDEESSFDEDMFLPNASSSVCPSVDDDDDDDDDDDVVESMDDSTSIPSMGESHVKKDNADDADGSSPSLENVGMSISGPALEDKEEQVDGSNDLDGDDGDVNSTTDRMVSNLAHDVPTIPEGMEDANSLNDEEGASGDEGGCKEIELAISTDDHKVTASVDNDDGADDMPLPDVSADDDYDPHEDDVQSSPSRPTVLDHAGIDPTPSRPTTTPTAQPAVQNVLAELPVETDLLVAALQRSAIKTPKIIAKKRIASPSPAMATPAPGLPFGEVRVGEAPIFSPLSFHGGAMVTTVASTGSVSSPSTAGESTESSGRYYITSAGLGAANGNDNEIRANTGMGKGQKARPSVGGVSRAGRASIGGAGRRRVTTGASAADGIGILGMLGTAPARTNEPLLEEENEDESSDGGSGGSPDTSAKDDESTSMVLEGGPREDTTKIDDDPSSSLKEPEAKGGEAEVEESKSTSKSNVESGCDISMARSNILRSPKCRGAANDGDVLETSFAQSSAKIAEQSNDIDAKDLGNASSSDTDSSDESSEGSDDETESEVSSSCSSISSDDVSIVLPNRKNKQGGRGARRNIQASDEESDTSYHVESSSDDAKDDDDEEDVLVYDGDKGDDGSYTIESDEEEEEDDDVLIYESDESSVKAKRNQRVPGAGAKPKAKTVIVESEDESGDSIEDGEDENEDESITANVEKSMAAVSIGDSQTVEDDGSVIEAEVVDDGDETADDNSAPSEETLLWATDELFVAAVDKDTITVRDIFRSLEERFSMALDKPTKKIIKGRLVALINEEERPVIARDVAPLPSSMDQIGATLASKASKEECATGSRSLVCSRKNSVSRGKWSRGAQLGVGSFGVVHMALNQRNGEMMAVKTLNLPDEDDLLADIEREVHLMRTLAHPNIVRYIGCERDQTHSTLSIFQEWVPGGSVSSLLRKFGAFPLPVIRKYLHQICTGLAYLHDNGIIHRDIKGSNILVTDEGVCKLADFGNSRRMGSDMEESLSMRGTPYFMAPEAFEGQCGMKSDIWSFGGVAVQMCSGIPPFKKSGVRNLNELISLLKESDGPPSLPENTDTVLHDLVRVCFERNPSQRPSAKDLFLHPFFSDADESSTVISGDSSFGLKSPSIRNRNSGNRQNGGDGESYHWPEYDKSQWPDWASNKEENKEYSPESNPFARKR